MKTDKQMDMTPHSSVAEAHILGNLLADNSLADRITFLLPEHFYTPVHGRIYQAICEFIDKGKIANPITLRTRFEKDDALKEVGGAKYLAAVLTQTHSFAGTIVDSANYVIELNHRCQLIAECVYAMEKLATEQDISESAALLAQACEKVTAGGKRFEMRDGNQVTQSIIDAMKKKQEIYHTGIERLNRAMKGGLYAGKSYAICGLKKHGKTIIAGQISCNLAISGVKHLFICGEMSPIEIHQRTLARLGDFEVDAFTNEEKRDLVFSSALAKAASLPHKNIIYKNAPGLTFDELKRIIKRAVVVHGIKGFILDYWQLVGGKDSKTSRSEHLDEVAQWIADISRKMNLFSLTTAQINQEGNTRGGEGIRLAFDQVYTLHRPDVSLPNAWIEMMDTRYTKWSNIGSEEHPGLRLTENGTSFEEVPYFE